MKLAWITDIHLNFLEQDSRKLFYQSLLDSDASGFLLSGDIADATTVSSILVEMAEYVRQPIYFVLGNHDYYHGSVTSVRREIMDLCRNYSLLHWLSEGNGIQTSSGCAIVGADCWADGRYGNYASSRVVLNDSTAIEELYQASVLGRRQLLDSMQKLADADAAQLKRNLDSVVGSSPERVVIVVHVPPFRENCTYQGKISSDDFLPFFSSKATGEIILKMARQYSKVDFQVVCGHTHSSSLYQPLQNLTVKSGAAEYHKPTIQEVIEV